MSWTGYIKVDEFTPKKLDIEHLVILKDIFHTYSIADASGQTLHGISLNILRGKRYALVGTSGSGKSTLLNILGLLDKPSSGLYLLDGVDVTQSSPDQLAEFRNRKIGFVFQSFNLLPRLNSLDNVALPLIYRGVPRPEARARAEQQLSRVGLNNKSWCRPADLSGGQRQRVAIARALIGEPILLLADEPTGNLDRNTAMEIMNLLLELNQKNTLTLLMVTHDNSLASQMDHCYEMNDGQLADRYYQHA